MAGPQCGQLQALDVGVLCLLGAAAGPRYGRFWPLPAGFSPAPSSFLEGAAPQPPPAPILPALAFSPCPLPRSTLGLNLGSLFLLLLSWFTRPPPGFFLWTLCLSLP